MQEIMEYRNKISLQRRKCDKFKELILSAEDLFNKVCEYFEKIKCIPDIFTEELVLIERKIDVIERRVKHTPNVDIYREEISGINEIIQVSQEIEDKKDILRLHSDKKRRKLVKEREIAISYYETDSSSEDLSDGVKAKALFKEIITRRQDFSNAIQSQVQYKKECLDFLRTLVRITTEAYESFENQIENNVKVLADEEKFAKEVEGALKGKIPSLKFVNQDAANPEILHEDQIEFNSVIKRILIRKDAVLQLRSEELLAALVKFYAILEKRLNTLDHLLSKFNVSTKKLLENPSQLSEYEEEEEQSYKRKLNHASSDWKTVFDSHISDFITMAKIHSIPV